MSARVLFIYTVIYAVCCLALLNSCQTKDKKKLPTDTKYSGHIVISADESFKPVIDAQVQVFESNHPDGHITIQYKPEAACLKDLAIDSVRMVLVSRTYSKQEFDFIADSLKTAPEAMVIARDAIAVIVNPRAQDSLFSMQEIKDILTGRFKKKLIPVFDGLQATSTVRYIVDSVLHGDSLGPQTRAAKTTPEVIDFVASNPDAVGFIGISWIGNRDDSDQLSYLKKVKMAWIESKDRPGQYILPVQSNIYPMGYPMVRDLVYILKDNYKGLGKGFADFMSGEIGQLIFRRAYLMPAQKNFTVRPVRLRE